MTKATAPPAEGNLYPTLPSTSPDQSYRLQEISQLKKRLEDERDERARLYKKYHHGVNAIEGVDAVLLTASIGMGVGGVGLLSTIIAAPVVLGLEIATLVCGILGVSGKFISGRLAVKAKKHDEIKVLAESKLNTIADRVSTALLDGTISDDEFRLIVDKVNKYNQMRAEIRTGAQKAHSTIPVS